MHAARFRAILASLAGSLPACSASLPRRQPQAGPFGGIGPPQPPADGSGLFWVFLGGLLVGLLAAACWRWLTLRRALKGSGGLGAPREIRLSRAALGLVEELLRTWRRQGVVVRLAWWRKRRRGD